MGQLCSLESLVTSLCFLSPCLIPSARHTGLRRDSTPRRCRTSLWLGTSVSLPSVWGFRMTSTLLPGNTHSCVTLYLSSVLNSVPDLPSIRRAAVQAWLETVSGGSLVMFVLSPLTITTFSLGSSAGTLTLEFWSCCECMPRSGRCGGAHACLTQAAHSCMDQTRTPCLSGKIRRRAIA